MKLSQLQVFLAVAQAGSIRKAAEQLRLAQPSLSRSISQLEEELGTPLLRRSVRGVVLTAAGNKVLARARLIDRELGALRDELRAADGTLSGEVVIGVAPLVALKYLPEFLDQFNRRHPQVQVRVADGLYPAVWARLRDGSLDAYFGPIPERLAPPDLKCETLFHSRVIATARRGNPLVRVRSLAALANARWVVAGPADGPGRIVEQLFASHALAPPRVIVESESFLALLALLGHTDMVALLPEAMLDASAYELLRIPIVERCPEPRQGVATLADATLAPAAAEFVRSFKAWLRKRARGPDAG